MKRTIRCSGFFLLLTLSVAVLLIEILVGTPVLAANQDASGRLAISKHTSNEITGVLNRPALAPSFTTRREGPSRVVVRVQVGSVVVDATADISKSTRSMDGYGKAVTLEEHNALRDLTGELEVYLHPHTQDLPPHAAFLFNMISYLSEAPVGWPLNHHTVTDQAVGTTAPSLVLESQRALAPQSPSPDESCLQYVTPPACEVTDTLGIFNLPGGCALTVYSVWHDAWTPFDHCFCREERQMGCKLTDPENCSGRCGIGCGVFIVDGKGRYTRDCAAHDRCCQVHGNCLNVPVSSSCGDEWSDAFDDTTSLTWPDNCTVGCYCGNLVCDTASGETYLSCPTDCPPPPPGGGIPTLSHLGVIILSGLLLVVGAVILLARRRRITH